MIITVTLNPAIDKTVTIEKLCVGELHKVRSSREDAGGKGINVSKTIKSLGGESVAVGFLGGTAGTRIRQALNALGIKECFTDVENPTRTNLKIADAEGCVTEVNEPGPEIAAGECERFCAGLRELVKPGDLVILSGSLPGGIGADFYAELTKEIHALGAGVFVDADGDVFAQAIEAGPDIIKPNLPELERYFAKKAGVNEAEKKEIYAQEGDSADMLERVVRLGSILRSRGIGEVIISMGADGAVFLTGEGDYYAVALSVPVKSTVGAGDAMVAAYAYARMQGLPMEERIRLCVAVSAGAVTTEGTNPADIETVNALKERVEVRAV